VLAHPSIGSPSHNQSYRHYTHGFRNAGAIGAPSAHLGPLANADGAEYERNHDDSAKCRALGVSARPFDGSALVGIDGRHLWKQPSKRRFPIKNAVICAALFSLSACVTARMHTQAELNGVTRQCGLALGELFQDESEKRLVFLFRPDSTPQERSCVAKWARKNGLKAVFVNALNFPAS
jgi:hypothetical protein